MSMAATYRAVMLTKKGGPEVLQIVELPIEPPRPGQLRVRVRAAGVGSTDLIMLAGNYPYAPKIPVVLGYEVAGVVEAARPNSAPSSSSASCTASIQEEVNGKRVTRTTVPNDLS
jgi:NADPH:quinone reductase-like Zn-dependent oxidoreductase